MLRTRSNLHLFSLVTLALFFIAAGVNHFVRPEFYLPIMPAWLPAPMALIYVSGIFEIVGGVAVLVPRLRHAAGWGLIALLIAVFPANIEMALNADAFADHFPVWLIWLRLPMQGLFVWWVYCAAIGAGLGRGDADRSESRQDF